LPDFEEGYTIAAIDLLKAITNVEKKDKQDDEFLYRYSRPTSVDRNMITGGITPEYLRRKLSELNQLCNYAIENDIKDIVIG
jgi:cAMP phosphodiesterase